MSRSAASSCALVNSGGDPFAFCPDSFSALFLGAAMAIPGERDGLAPLYPNSNRRERIACAGDNLAMPHCSAARLFRNRFDYFLKFADWSAGILPATDT